MKRIIPYLHTAFVVAIVMFLYASFISVMSNVFGYSWMWPFIPPFILVFIGVMDSLSLHYGWGKYSKYKKM